MTPLGNRRCRYDGCTTYGGSVYMDAHEAEQHCRCLCGWIGASKNMPWHRSQRRRHDDAAIDQLGPGRLPIEHEIAERLG